MRRITDPELDKAVQTETTYSQHSSIVANVKVSEKLTAYDRAIGQCVAFKREDLWKELFYERDPLDFSARSHHLVFRL